MNSSFKAKFNELPLNKKLKNPIKINVNTFSELLNDAEKSLKVQIAYNISTKMVVKDKSYSMICYVDTIVVESNEDQVQMKVYSDKEYIYLSIPKGNKELIGKFRNYCQSN